MVKAPEDHGLTGEALPTKSLSQFEKKLDF
jgi:hypothetical protein